MVAMETLGVRAEAEMLEPDALQKVYQERMSVIEQKCAEDIHELLLERLDLFHDYTPDPREITEKLMVSVVLCNIIQCSIVLYSTVTV